MRREVTAVPDRQKIYAFAQKWLGKFGDQNINYVELVDHFIADDCEDLGFKMDCGNGFEEKYGEAVSDNDVLVKVIASVTDILLLGSAIYSRWRYFNHWAYDAAEILEPNSRAWFVTALSRLKELSCESPLLQGRAKKIKIISNGMGYGPLPEPHDEAEQHLTIADDGRVWFSSYNYAGAEKPKCLRKKQFKLSPEATERIFADFTQYFSADFECIFATDIGTWEMTIKNTDGRDFCFAGSLCCDFEIDGIDLSDLLRDALGMDDLFVFDGNNKPDVVNRIAINYHRVTKIKLEEPISDNIEYATWDYSEQLVLDRASETIEHIQNIDTGCVITRTFKVQDGVADFLDNLDADRLFSNIEGNPDDIIETPLETKDYTIAIDFKRSAQCVIEGGFDKYGLPDDWAEFAGSLWDFMMFYGFGEILNPNIFGKARRRTGDYIFCSVSFEEDGKTYYYIAEDDEISVGDFVIVPVGKENHESFAKVENIEYFGEDNIPFPLDRTKKIIRRFHGDNDETDNSDKSVTIPEGTVIMGSEPLAGVTADAWRTQLGEDYTDESLAAALAGAWNKSGWLGHDLGDDACTPEVEAAYKEWYALEEELIGKIALRLKRKCETPYIKLVTPFMERNGYRDGGGWWVKKEV